MEAPGVPKREGPVEAPNAGALAWPKAGGAPRSDGWAAGVDAAPKRLGRCCCPKGVEAPPKREVCCCCPGCPNGEGVGAAPKREGCCCPVCPNGDGVAAPNAGAGCCPNGFGLLANGFAIARPDVTVLV